MSKTVNLAGFMPADAAVLEILAPGGVERTGWGITFSGPGHPEAVAWQNEQQRKNLRIAQQREAAQVNGRKYKPEDRTVEEQRRENVGWVVARILDWTPVDFGQGEVRFSKEAATDLLMQPRMAWAFLQMVEFLNEDRSFTPRSEKTSEPSPGTSSGSRSDSPTAAPSAST